MGLSLQEYQLNVLQQMLTNMKSSVQVAGSFKGRMQQIKGLLSNDKTALVSPILNFMINAGNVPITFNANKTGLTNLFADWQKNVNKDLNIDIPRGLDWVGEQYYRERWKSSLIVIRIKWGNFHGYKMPEAIYVMDGASIGVENKTGNLDDNKYFLGTPGKGKLLSTTDEDTVYIRKPYSQGYEQYPSPYLVQRGALEYALQKNMVVNKQSEMIDSVFPYYIQLKLGSMEAMRHNQNPTEEDLKKLTKAFQKKKAGYDTHEHAKGLIGSHSYDFDMKEFIPDFGKILDDKILKGIDKNLLYALGMIELKGFSSTREEAILNPKVLVTEIENAVLDYVKLMNEIVSLIQEKNAGKYKLNDKVSVQPGIIKAFLTDEMKTLIRSWFDRGIVGYKTGLESTTALNFETQVKERITEKRENIDVVCYPRLTMNMEKDGADLEPNEENVPDDKKKNGPEADNYKNAKQTYKCECVDCGHPETSTQHCKDIKCSKCGGEMRRKNRPSTNNQADRIAELIEAQYSE